MFESYRTNLARLDLPIPVSIHTHPLEPLLNFCKSQKKKQKKNTFSLNNSHLKQNLLYPRWSLPNGRPKSGIPWYADSCMPEIRLFIIWNKVIDYLPIYLFICLVIHREKLITLHFRDLQVKTNGNLSWIQILIILIWSLIHWPPNKSCWGSQSMTIMLSVNCSCMLPFSHFQNIRWGIRAKTRAKICWKWAGIEDTGMSEPKVNTMNPLVAPSANSCRS